MGPERAQELFQIPGRKLNNGGLEINMTIRFPPDINLDVIWVTFCPWTCWVFVLFCVFGFF